jgi:hypothetical protein
MLPQARTEKLLIQEVGDELIVYDETRDRAHRLNATATTVWRHCDGKTDVADLTRLLAKKLDLPPEEDLIWLALSRLEAAHLLCGPVRHPDAASVSRRAVMRKIGMVGTLTLLLPVVTSIMAPTPAMSQSCGVTCCCWSW